MEHQLDTVIEDFTADQKITGALLVTPEGLCIKTIKQASDLSSGTLLSIMNEAAKLEPNYNPPTVILENDEKKCYLHKYGLLGVVYAKK